jgi:hypothetical protein
MLMSPQDYLDIRFAKTKRRPTAGSVRRWVESGELPGQKIGGRWFVEYDPQAPHTGSEIADRILKAS